MTEYVHAAASELSTEELLAACWERGNLAPLMHEGQRALRDQFHTWRKIDQTNDVDHVAGSLPRVFAVAAARRFRKTSLALMIASELAVERPGVWMRYTSAFQKSIDEIIGTVMPKVFESAPEGCVPQYFGKRGPLPAGLYYPKYGPMGGARIALAGLDMNPNALRGQSSEYDFISEAGYIDRLIYAIRSVLYQQYIGRPHARMMLESSAPELIGTDWETEILPDCLRRGALFEATIDDNPALTPAERSEFIAAAGGRGHPTCEREYYNLIGAEPEKLVVPEFSMRDHVVEPADWPTPAYAMTHVGFDPGVSDPFGTVWFYFNWERQCIVVQAAWMKANASTGEVVRVTHDMERQLWGTQHREPNNPAEPIRYVRELSIADACKTGDAKVWTAPPQSLTYWDPGEYTLKPNPYSRVSDIANRFILDMNKDYGLGVRPAEKSPGSKEADTEHLRSLFEARPVRIVILNNGLTEKLIQQLRGGMWDTDENNHRTDWRRSKTLGHLDCLAALKYAVRDVLWNRNPNRPPFVDPNQTLDHHVPDEIRDRARASTHVTNTYGGRGQHAFDRQTGYRGR